MTAFQRALTSLLLWWETDTITAMIIGGIAASLLGKPRLTQDIDALIDMPEDQLENFFKRAPFFGFEPRRPDAFKFAKKNRVLLLRHSDSGINVDLSLAGLPFEKESFQRSIRVNLEELSLPFPTPDDLIIMKAVAHRPKDLLDIEALLEIHKKLDIPRIKKWVREFSQALEQPEMYQDLKKLLKKRHSPT